MLKDYYYDNVKPITWSYSSLIKLCVGLHPIRD